MKCYAKLRLSWICLMLKKKRCIFSFFSRKKQRLAFICRRIQCNFVWGLSKLWLKPPHQSNHFSRYSHILDSFYMNLVLPLILHPCTFHPIMVIVKMLVKCNAFAQKWSRSRTLKDNVGQFLKNRAFKVVRYIAAWRYFHDYRHHA